MSGLNTEYPDLVKDISGDIVAEVSPDETGSFDEIFSALASGKASTDNSDRILGFGVDALLYLNSPVVIGMVSSVLAFLSAEVLKSLKDESSSYIKEKIKLIFKKSGKQEAVSLPVFTKEQFAELRRLSVESAKKNGASDEDAEKFANALIARMNLPS